MTYRVHYTEGGVSKTGHWTDPEGVSIRANLDYLDSIGAEKVEIEFGATGKRLSKSDYLKHPGSV